MIAVIWNVNFQLILFFHQSIETRTRIVNFLLGLFCSLVELRQRLRDWGRKKRVGKTQQIGIIINNFFETLTHANWFSMIEISVVFKRERKSNHHSNDAIGTSKWEDLFFLAIERTCIEHIDNNGEQGKGRDDDEESNTYLYRLVQGLLWQQGRWLHAQWRMRNDSLISIVSKRYR